MNSFVHTFRGSSVVKREQVKTNRNILFVVAPVIKFNNNLNSILNIFCKKCTEQLKKNEIAGRPTRRL